MNSKRTTVVKGTVMTLLGSEWSGVIMGIAILFLSIPFITFVISYSGERIPMYLWKTSFVSFIIGLLGCFWYVKDRLGRGLELRIDKIKDEISIRVTGSKVSGRIKGDDFQFTYYYYKEITHANIPIYHPTVAIIRNGVYEMMVTDNYGVIHTLPEGWEFRNGLKDYSLAQITQGKSLFYYVQPGHRGLVEKIVMELQNSNQFSYVAISQIVKEINANKS